MPVFDFSNPAINNDNSRSVLTLHFTLIKMLLLRKIRFFFWTMLPAKWAHHSCGVFTNPAKHTAFEFEEEDGIISADILTN